MPRHEQEGAGRQLAGNRHVPAGELAARRSSLSAAFTTTEPWSAAIRAPSPPEPPSVFTSCHGVWTHLEKRKFAYTSLELISDLSGNLVGYLKVRGIYTVSQSGNEYTGTSFAEILDIDGNVLFSVERDQRGTADPGRTALSAQREPCSKSVT